MAKQTASGPYRTLSERLAAEAAAGGYQPGTWAPVVLPAYVADAGSAGGDGDGAAARLDSNDAVYLRGGLALDFAAMLATAGSNSFNDQTFDGAPGTVIVATLPEVFWPEQTRYISQVATAVVGSGLAALPVVFYIGADGTVEVGFGDVLPDGSSMQTLLSASGTVYFTFVGLFHPE